MIHTVHKIGAAGLQSVQNAQVVWFSPLFFFSFSFFLLLLLPNLSPCLNICQFFLNISLNFRCRLPYVALHGVCHCRKRWWNISARAWFLKQMQNFSSPQETLLSYFTKLNHISMNPNLMQNKPVVENLVNHCTTAWNKPLRFHQMDSVFTITGWHRALCGMACFKLASGWEFFVEEIRLSLCVSLCLCLCLSLSLTHTHTHTHTLPSPLPI